jgi:Fe-S-cluster-containing dehydrogenase component
VKDGAVVTACQAACPSAAIVFGDLNDRESRVAKWAALPHNYGVLTELGTRPRTTYLARVSNPNPQLAAPADHSHAGGSGTAAALS